MQTKTYKLTHDRIKAFDLSIFPLVVQQSLRLILSQLLAHNALISEWGYTPGNDPLTEDAIKGMREQVLAPLFQRLRRDLEDWDCASVCDAEGSPRKHEPQEAMQGPGIGPLTEKAIGLHRTMIHLYCDLDELVADIPDNERDGVLEGQVDSAALACETHVTELMNRLVRLEPPEGFPANAARTDIGLEPANMEGVNHGH